VAFNALQLNNKSRPHNPLINSGAIMMCSLIQNSEYKADRFEFIIKQWMAMAGGKHIGFDMAVYLSEQGTADRNFALAYFMNEKNAFPEDTDINQTLELYFQCCSLLINADAMAVVAATLANGGVCPLTGEQILSAETVKCCLSIMGSCGMYDYSGEFAFKVGLPAKSGVGGAIFSVIPGVMGICTFSPCLDRYGNSF